MTRTDLTFIVCLALAGCGGSSGTSELPDNLGPKLVCGPGMIQVDNRCVTVGRPAAPMDAGFTPVEAGFGDSAGGFGDSALLPDGTLRDAGALGDARSEAGGFVPSEGGATSCYAVDPAHDNAAPDEKIASPLKEAWVARFDGGASYPLVSGDRVIIAANESQPNVRALDVTSGSLLWGPVTFGALPLVAIEGGQLFALSNGVLRAIDIATGQMHWSTTLAGQSYFPSPPVASGGLVYVNGLESGGTTYAVDEQTGATVWTANTFDGSDGTVAVGGGVVYEAEDCDQLSSFDALTGQRNWYHSTSCTGGGGRAPSFYAGQIWVRDDVLGDVILNAAGNVTGSFKAGPVPSFHNGTAFYMQSGTLSAVDVSTQTAKWTFAGDGQLCTSAVIAGGGGQVFVGSSLGAVYELDETTGMQKSTNAPDAGGGVTCGTETMSMGLGGGHLLVPAGNALVVY